MAIERKDLETRRLKDFVRYMVTSNQDASLKIDIGDSRIVCFEVSASVVNGSVWSDLKPKSN